MDKFIETIWNNLKKENIKNFSSTTDPKGMEESVPKQFGLSFCDCRSALLRTLLRNCRMESDLFQCSQIKNGIKIDKKTDINVVASHKLYFNSIGDSLIWEIYVLDNLNERNIFTFKINLF
jgi:hypothetical protein